MGSLILVFPANNKLHSRHIGGKMYWHNDFDGPTIADSYAKSMGVGPYEEEEEKEEKTFCECGEFEADYECFYWNMNFKNGKKFKLFICKKCLQEFINTCIEDGDSYEIKEI